MTKYIFVTGGVLSSVGKGIVAASTGKMLQARGFSVTVSKIDPYLNVDAGTMNPFVHGEVFVAEDGGETDLDLGHYERFLDVNLPSQNNITTGQVYRKVIERERKGDYLGQCVQIIPHITEEIKERIRKIASQSQADVVIVEIGGTAGDIEGLPFLEAIRQMRLEEGFDNTLFTHVALVPTLSATNELKTKPCQHSIQELRRIGIQPDIVVARANVELDEESRRKIALHGSVSEDAVFTSYDVDLIYNVPLVLDEQGMGTYVVGRLKLAENAPDWNEWRHLIETNRQACQALSIGLCGKYTRLSDSYVSIVEALKHAALAKKCIVNITWLDAESLEEQQDAALSKLPTLHGIVILPGFGSRGAEGKIRAVRFARENGLPMLGICFGLQLAVVEFARNVAGLKGANTTEVDPRTPHPVIDLLPEQKGVDVAGGTMRLGSHATVLEPGTVTHRLYGLGVVFERHRHRYEVNPAYWNTLQRYGLVLSGWSPDRKRVEFIELEKHPFFVATQAHPEFKSRPGKPSPPYLGFIQSCLEKAVPRAVHAD